MSYSPFIPKKVFTLGHDPVLDGNGRWTCTTCHAAVLIRGSNVYGSATQIRCTRANTSAKRED